MNCLNKGTIKSIIRKTDGAKTATKVTLNLDNKSNKETNIIYFDDKTYEIKNVADEYEVIIENIDIFYGKKCYFVIEKGNYQITEIGIIDDE